MAKGNPYGERHRQERQEKLESMEAQRCEVTSSEKQLEAHHAVPRMFNGPDLAANYQILTSHFHQQILHTACNIQDPKLVGHRTYLSNSIKKHILDDEKREKAHEEIRKIDKIMIAEYITNMLNKLAHTYREKVIELTLINNFETIRDLHIENMKLKKMMEAYPIPSHLVE